ncbi:hypothetical protein [Amycolatopsis thermoflava]|uniref:hypothetical protein n=1 Tax=Amycolatopsis thermoflava TaxID=84480 RepID=UPI00365A1A3E
MPATPTFSLPYPAATDPPNVPLHMQQLAEAAETALASRSVKVVSVLPASGDYTAQIVFNATDLLLYRWTGTTWIKLDADKPACTVAVTGTKSIANNVDSDVPWDLAEENWSDGAGNPMWSVSGPDTRVTIRRDGLYLAGFQINYLWVNATGKRTATITRNNTGVPTNASVVCYDSYTPTATVLATSLKATGQVRCVAGDILRLSTYQNSGGALNIQGNTIEGRSRMFVTWVKP